MQDHTQAVLTRFFAYAQAFETKDTKNVTPFFFTPAILMTKDEVAPMPDAEAVTKVFQKLFDDLNLKGFDKSKLNTYQVKQLSDNQAIVSGTATRLDKAGAVLEKFGLTYTLRMDPADKNEWKIIAGVLHDTTLLVMG
jgi:hypothetical protein